jgi:hypothetical protein
MRVALGYLEQPKSAAVKAPVTYQVYSDLWPMLITTHVPIRQSDLINTFISEGQAQRLPHLDALLHSKMGYYWRLAANHLDPKTPIPRLWKPWYGAILIGDALRSAVYPISSKKAAAGRTYEATLLKMPPQPPEDPFSSLISTETSRRASLESLESFNTSILLRQITPNPAPKGASHKRQISAAIPRNERLNKPQTPPGAPQQQDQQEVELQPSGGAPEAPGAGQGPGAGQDAGTHIRKSGRARKPKTRS